ncbi:MAG: heme exporter protein CcmB [Thermaerobacter sp.]|nr:heme exporter protein CcmB [Thermaerobacter sp.]
MPPALRKFIVLVVKDLVLETRQFDAGLLMIAFAALELLLSVFALGTERSLWTHAAAGILWMESLFAGILSVTRIYARELPEDAYVGVDLAPGGRLSVFWAKICVGSLFVGITEAVVSLPSWHLAVLAPGNAGVFGLVLALGAVGIAAVGTMMSAMMTGLSGPSPLLAVLAMALEVPLAISAIEATLQLQRGLSPWLWIHGLIAYDVIFVTLPVLLYEFLWEV